MRVHSAQRTSGRAARSNPNPSGYVGGTPGGVSQQGGGQAMSFGSGRAVMGGRGMMNEEDYLLILAILEVLLTGWLRNIFRRYHGG